MFRIYFGRLLNPQHEVFGGKVYLGTAVSLVGALALSISTELVLDLRSAARTGRRHGPLAMAVTL